MNKVERFAWKLAFQLTLFLLIVAFLTGYMFFRLGEFYSTLGVSGV